MPFQVSPGVNISEIDLTTVTPAVSSTEGAFAGVFNWGPLDTRVLIDSEPTLLKRFGKPGTNNAETFFTAANFLAYGNKLYVVRAANTTGTDSNTAVWSAIANTSAVSTLADRVVYNIRSQDDYDSKNMATATQVLYAAKWPGAAGNSLKVSVCDSPNAYSSSANLLSNTAVSSGVGTFFTVNVGDTLGTVALANTVGNTVATCTTVATALTTSAISLGDYVAVGNSTIGTQYLKVTAISAVTSNTTQAFFTISFDSTFNLSANVSTQSFTRYWEYFNVVNKAPTITTHQSLYGNTVAKDELHVVVADEDGTFSGTPGTVLEVFGGVSRSTDAKTPDGAVNYYKRVINDGSQYLWFGNDRSGAVSNTAVNVIDSTNVAPLRMSLGGGTNGLDENTVTIGDLSRGFDQFKSAESVDISLVLVGKARGGTYGEQMANYIIDNIAESRKDCVVFISPDSADVVRASGNEATNVIQFRNALHSSSYAVLDSGYKYQYDKYNDVYRYIPMNGDTAGLCVRTDDTRDPWFSPAGFNRGQIKNIVKLAYNPSKADRDQLYKAGINPVVTFPGQGTVLFGDKTLLANASAFDRINVRRLFIVLEKAIAKAAKSLLFEFNDDLTRAQFRNIVEPFLRDVQGRRGITAFKVVCDNSNNTSQVIDSNQFVGDIYIKPAKSINFIQLNFVAVRSGVEFSEIIGSK